MPDDDALRRVAALATCTRTLRALNPSTDKIVADCAQDYARTLNGIAFRAVHKADANNELMQLLEPPPVEQERSIPERGTHLIERASSYKDAFASFRFQSCLTRPEVFTIITDVRTENEKILLLKPFNHVAKSTRVDDFGKLQRDATDAVAQKLKKEWPRTVTTCLRQHLRHVTKGWYNLEESSDDIYKKSKLKQFLRCLNLMMEACMRTLLTNSVNEYAAFLKLCTASQVTVTDCNTVVNDANFRRPPLFAVDLAVEGTEFTYSSPLESFVNVPLERFNDLMTQTQSITRVERVVMRNLFWSFEPVMKSVHPSEEWVSELREEVRTALSASVEPLKAYLTTYEKYLEFLRLDVDAYVAQAEEDYGGPPPGLSEDERNELNKPDLNVNELRKMAEEHLQAKLKVEDSVPEVIDVGAYHVSTQKVRRLLADKHQETATKLLDLVARKTGDNATDASGEFQRIMDRCVSPRFEM